MHAIAEFLRAFPPFKDSTAEQLDAVVAATEIEFFPQGSLVLRAGEGASDHVYVVRKGQAELLDDGRLVDVLDSGDVFGIPSMLTDLPPGLDVRAAEDLLVYRVAAAPMLPLFSNRAGLRFLGATVRERSTSRGGEARLVQAKSPRLAEIVRAPAIVRPETPIRDVVRLMHDNDASCAVITADGSWGIVTDNDLRHRVLAPERDLADAVSTIMTANALSVRADLAAEDAVLVMLMHSIRHLLVVDLAGQLLGVLEEVDLLAAQSRAPLRLRRAIARARSIAELAEIATGVLPSLITAHESGRYPERVTASYSVLVESVLGRLLDLAQRDRSDAPAPFALVISGSLARRELVPSSDIDTLLVWDGPDDDSAISSWMRELASFVLDGLSACGFSCDDNGVRADDVRFSRSLDAWLAAVRGWSEEPAERQGDIYLATLADARAINGGETWKRMQDEVTMLLQLPRVRAIFARVAEAHRMPTGFTNGLVIEATGDHRATLDLKASGLAPIVDMARYLATGCGSTALSTLDRLQDAHDSRRFRHEDIHDLRDAFLLLTGLRLDHQSALIQAGRQPDNELSPSEVSSLMLRQLRDALRAVARAQRNLDIGQLGRRW